MGSTSDLGSSGVPGLLRIPPEPSAAHTEPQGVPQPEGLSEASRVELKTRRLLSKGTREQEDSADQCAGDGQHARTHIQVQHPELGRTLPWRPGLSFAQRDKHLTGCGLLILGTS